MASKFTAAKPQGTGKIKWAGFAWLIGIIGFIIFAATAATEDYSNGERIGFITRFSHKGRFWKSWEGELNLTQTGMNTSSVFDFSLDNDNEPAYLVTMIDSAVDNGWKVKLIYHETYFKNWLSNRGETDHFIKSMEVMDKHPIINGQNAGTTTGHVIDTVFVVVDKSELFRKK